MSQTADEEKLSEEAQERIRAEVRALMEREGLTQSKIAQESGIKYGTLTPFMSGKYLGDGSRVARDLRRWMDSRARGEAVRSAVASASGFVATPSAQDYMTLLSAAQHLPDISVIVGAPGTGKTEAAREYARQSPNAWLVTMRETTSTQRSLLSALARAMRVTDHGSSYEMSCRIEDRLHGSRGLLIVDEAQLLTSEQMNNLRSFHDACGIGIAYLGNHRVLTRLRGERKEADYAQLYSRVGMHIERKEPQAGDVKSLLDAWGVPAGEARNLLRGIARKSGYLRNLQRCHRLACMIAQSEGVALAASHVTVAWERMAAATASAGAEA